MKNQRKLTTVRRASAASEASGASRSLRQALRSKNVPRDLCRKAKRAGGNQKEIGASRSISNQVYVGVVFDGFSLVFQAFFDLGGLKVLKTFQDAPKTCQDAPKTPPRRAKTPPRRPQDAPRRPKRCPGAPQDAPKSI